VKAGSAASLALVARLLVANRWDGAPLPADEHAVVEVRWSEHGELLLSVDAPYYGDVPPSAAAGSTEGLWEHELVEVFFADAHEHYLEIELGPHGHYLVLELSGVRKAVRRGLPIQYSVSCQLTGALAGQGPIGRFHGVARVPRAYLPAGVTRANAYAIHGVGVRRCYHACSTLGHAGSAPDFHRLESFVPITLR
jgi:hypothetical protein